MTIVVAAATLALGLSACGTSEQDRSAATAELSKRGFEDVQYVKDQPEGAGSYKMLFTGKFVNCRVEITRNYDGTFELSGPTFSLTRDQKARLTQKVGGEVNDIVNVSFLSKYATDLGLQHCTA